jgi:hypothetical protein
VKDKAFGLRYALGATVFALLAVLVGRLVVDGGDFTGVVAGAGIALVLQIGVFLLLGVLLFPARRLLVFGLGMAARFTAVLVAALLAPHLGLPLAPLLFTLAAVLVLTTLLEPILIVSEPERAS